MTGHPITTLSVHKRNPHYHFDVSSVQCNAPNYIGLQASGSARRSMALSYLTSACQHESTGQSPLIHSIQPVVGVPVVARIASRPAMHCERACSAPLRLARLMQGRTLRVPTRGCSYCDPGIRSPAYHTGCMTHKAAADSNTTATTAATDGMRPTGPAAAARRPTPPLPAPWTCRSNQSITPCNSSQLSDATLCWGSDARVLVKICTRAACVLAHACRDKHQLDVCYS